MTNTILKFALVAMLVAPMPAMAHGWRPHWHPLRHHRSCTWVVHHHHRVRSCR